MGMGGTREAGGIGELVEIVPTTLISTKMGRRLLERCKVDSTYIGHLGPALSGHNNRWLLYTV